MAHTSDETTARNVADHPPSAGALDHAFRTLLEPVCAALARIESSLNGRDVDFPTPQPATTLPQNQTKPKTTAADSDQMLQRLDSLQTSFNQLEERVAIALDLESLEPVDEHQELDDDRPEQPPTPWEQILLDDDLRNNPALTEGRRQFLQDVADGDPAARILAGHLMIARAADQQELPEMLRHVGEAYYRWHPRTSETPEDPWEEALAAWLNRLVERAGLPNSIQLVRPGERFDNARHNASSRGFEIVAVHGWVVLRDRTKVYTRANVTVK
jgi:hypothetical protein